MTKAGERLIAGMKEAQAVATGLIPAARIHQRGFSYVPENQWMVTPPPKDRPFLAYGKPTDIEGCRWLSPGVHLAYWDHIDSAYCIKGATWMGPFIEPLAWQEEPAPPALSPTL